MDGFRFCSRWKKSRPLLRSTLRELQKKKCADKKDIAVVDVYAPFRLFFLLSIQALKGETFLTKFVIVLFFFKCFGQVFTQRVIDYRIIRRCHDRLITVCKNFDTSTLTHFRPSRAGHTPMNQRAEGAQNKTKNEF